MDLVGLLGIFAALVDAPVGFGCEFSGIVDKLTHWDSRLDSVLLVEKVLIRTGTEKAPYRERRTTAVTAMTIDKPIPTLAKSFVW